MLDKKLFVNLMTGLCDMFDKKPSEFIYDAYYESLKEFEYPAVESAVRKVIATHRFNTLPKPVDILEYLQETKDDRAMIAWLSVRGAIENYGYTDTLEFDDPIISHCIFQMGGWIEVCQVLNKDIPFMEKEFMELYKLYAKRDISVPVKLSGYFEVTNRANGFLDKIPAPKRIELPKRLKMLKE